MGISAFLITFNEAERIERTLDSLSWTDEQIVVDSGSTDGTQEICRRKGAKVFERQFDNFANQKNYALSQTTQEWVLSIDADETVSPELSGDILKNLSNYAYDGFYLNRQNYFLRKPLKFGRHGKERVLRFFRKGKGEFDGAVHEIVNIKGEIGELNGVLIHEGTRSLKQYFEKLKFYTELETLKAKAENKRPNLFKALIYPPGMWFVDYILYGGFLDGWRGFLYHGLSCYYGWIKNFKCRQ